MPSTSINLHDGALQALMNSGLFSPAELASMSRVRKPWCTHAKTPLEKEAINRLISHVVKGEQEKAATMIAANPKLLLMKGEAVDYSGRIIQATPFQATLGAEDSLMWEMMIPYFKRLEQDQRNPLEGKTAREVMLEQFNEQFPDGLIGAEQVQKEYAEIKAYYDTLVTNIADEEGAEAKEKILDEFRVNINTAGTTVRSGKHFNMQHLLAAYHTYNDKFNELGTWDNRDLFWVKVIGFVQRQIPAHYAQAHCNGLRQVAACADNFRRTLKLGSGVFFPLSGGGLGFDFAVYSYYDAGARGQRSGVRGMRLWPARRAGVGGAWAGKYYRAKTDSLARFRSKLERESEAQFHCLIL